VCIDVVSVVLLYVYTVMDEVYTGIRVCMYEIIDRPCPVTTTTAVLFSSSPLSVPPSTRGMGNRLGLNN
jgi:hypothetical protein